MKMKTVIAILVLAISAAAQTRYEQYSQMLTSDERRSVFALETDEVKAEVFRDTIAAGIARMDLAPDQIAALKRLRGRLTANAFRKGTAEYKLVQESEAELSGLLETVEEKMLVSVAGDSRTILANSDSIGLKYNSCRGASFGFMVKASTAVPYCNCEVGGYFNAICLGAGSTCYPGAGGSCNYVSYGCGFLYSAPCNGFCEVCPWCRGEAG